MRNGNGCGTLLVIFIIAFTLLLVLCITEQNKSEEIWEITYTNNRGQVVTITTGHNQTTDTITGIDHFYAPPYTRKRIK